MGTLAPDRICTPCWCHRWSPVRGNAHLLESYYSASLLHKFTAKETQELDKSPAPSNSPKLVLLVKMLILHCSGLYRHIKPDSDFSWSQIVFPYVIPTLTSWFLLQVYRGSGMAQTTSGNTEGSGMDKLWIFAEAQEKTRPTWAPSAPDSSHLQEGPGWQKWSLVLAAVKSSKKHKGWSGATGNTTNALDFY